MFGIFQSPTEKKATMAAEQFFSNLSRWEDVIGREKLSSWLGVEKSKNFANVLNLCFFYVQIYEGCRILNKVAPSKYADYFGEKLGAMMQADNVKSMQIYSNMINYINRDLTCLFNPTEPIARWVLLITIQNTEPSEVQLHELMKNVRVASESSLNLLKNACIDFRFPEELLIKKFDADSNLAKHVLQNGLEGKY